MSQNLLDALDGWNSVKSAELYGVGAWGQGHFMVTDDGFAAVNLKNATGTVRVNLSDIVHGLHDRGMSLPLLLRFSDLLGNRIRLINESFKKAIADYAYQNVYRGVFPIKVNQQQQAVHDVVTFGAPYHHGLEAGSKAELIAALAYMRDPEAFLICNGYKDAEFIDLALSSLKMGLQTILVLETTDELNLILERSAALGIRPRMGIRV
ncbi:MAG: arginine decarboxylase, partial [Lentisphaerae bacterium]|nr:arginine decarboxylase [Lentisphaerota bacterium]